MSLYQFGNVSIGGSYGYLLLLLLSQTVLQGMPLSFHFCGPVQVVL